MSIPASATSNYPAAYDDAAGANGAWSVYAFADDFEPNLMNRARSSILALQKELGVDPAGASATVVARLNSADSSFSTHSGDSTIHFTKASIDHGGIGGLADDDHTRYFDKSATDASRNTMTVSANYALMTLNNTRVDGVYNILLLQRNSSTIFGIDNKGQLTTGMSVEADVSIFNNSVLCNYKLTSTGNFYAKTKIYRGSSDRLLADSANIHTLTGLYFDSEEDDETDLGIYQSGGNSLIFRANNYNIFSYNSSGITLNRGSFNLFPSLTGGGITQHYFQFGDSILGGDDSSGLKLFSFDGDQDLFYLAFENTISNTIHSSCSYLTYSPLLSDGYFVLSGGYIGVKGLGSQGNGGSGSPSAYYSLENAGGDGPNNVYVGLQNKRAMTFVSKSEADEEGAVGEFYWYISSWETPNTLEEAMRLSYDGGGNLSVNYLTCSAVNASYLISASTTFDFIPYYSNHTIRVHYGNGVGAANFNIYSDNIRLDDLDNFIALNGDYWISLGNYMRMPGSGGAGNFIINQPYTSVHVGLADAANVGYNLYQASLNVHGGIRFLPQSTVQNVTSTNSASPTAIAVFSGGSSNYSFIFVKPDTNSGNYYFSIPTNIGVSGNQVPDGFFLIIKRTSLNSSAKIYMNYSTSAALAGNWMANIHSTLTLIFEGGVWTEISRSANTLGT